ncbi:MAG: hypothetical protein QM714_08335 [Nocardioides sp.]|uniref:hypothetical protein n=1 Tax=Nocardioides sp. TaxID=35761 RepID=UPI0039E45C91
MKKPVATIAAALILGGTAVISAGVAPEPNPPRTPWWMRTPCAYEDSANCYWNAGEQGDGQGHSFYVRKFPHRTCWMYVQRAYAKKHDHCEAHRKGRV